MLRGSILSKHSNNSSALCCRKVTFSSLELQDAQNMKSFSFQRKCSVQSNSTKKNLYHQLQFIKYSVNNKKIECKKAGKLIQNQLLLYSTYSMQAYLVKRFQQVGKQLQRFEMIFQSLFKLFNGDSSSSNIFSITFNVALLNITV